MPWWSASSATMVRRTVGESMHAICIARVVGHSRMLRRRAASRLTHRSMKPMRTSLAATPRCRSGFSCRHCVSASSGRQHQHDVHHRLALVAARGGHARRGIRRAQSLQPAQHRDPGGQGKIRARRSSPEPRSHVRTSAPASGDLKRDQSHGLPYGTLGRTFGSTSMSKVPAIVPISDLRDDAANVLERMKKSSGTSGDHSTWAGSRRHGQHRGIRAVGA